MATPAGSILPQSYFDGLSSLWGGCAYIAAGLVATGVVVQVVRSRPGSTDYLGILGKVFLIALATAFLREWLMRLNDIVMSFGALLGIDPRTVDERFVAFISGKNVTQPDTSVWDVIWGTESVGTAISYALLWLFGWLAWCVQYIVKLIGGILLTAGWAVSPIFLAFFVLGPMAGVARKFLLGLVALVCWPFGWALAAVVTNAMLETAAAASLVPVIAVGSPSVAPLLGVLLIGAWMIVTSVLAPYITTKVLLMGENPAAALARGVGHVAEAALAGGVGAATAAVTGGATAGAVVAAAATGALAAGSESAARGGGSARMTGAATSGLWGFYGGMAARQGGAAFASAASSLSRMAESAASTASSQAEQAEFFREARRRMSRRTERAAQPHEPDPNQAAIDIDSKSS
jgi:type IV secretion system protein TrbL